MVAVKVTFPPVCNVLFCALINKSFEQIEALYKFITSFSVNARFQIPMSSNEPVIFCVLFDVLPKYSELILGGIFPIIPENQY